MKKITIRDVAKEAGVSVTLVSFVLNAKIGKDGQLDCPVNPDTADRVLKVAKKLGYRRNNAAASLRSGRSRTIAVITSDIANPFFSEICRNIENIAYKAGYTVIFASSDENAEKLSHLIDTVLGYNVEGIIVAPCPGSEKVLERALDYNIPTVLIDRDVPGNGFGRIMVDNEDTGYQAAKYLSGRGLKKIEMVSYDISITSLSEREQGYMRAMADDGLASNVRIHKLPYDVASARVETDSVLDDVKARGVEGLILPTKKIGMYVIAALREKNIRIPQDLSVVCYDESDLFDMYPGKYPHIVQPLADIARESFSLLQKLISGENCERNINLRATFKD